MTPVGSAMSKGSRMGFPAGAVEWHPELTGSAYAP